MFLSTMLLLLFILILLLLLEGLLSQSLVSSFTEARSTTSWSALQNSPSSRRANSSPGISCLLQATQRKQSIWYEFSRAFITKSFLAKLWSHLEHFCPNNLKFITKYNWRGSTSKWKVSVSRIYMQSSWIFEAFFKMGRPILLGAARKGKNLLRERGSKFMPFRATRNEKGGVFSIESYFP